VDGFLKTMDSFSLFATIATAIVLEAMPFLAVGALLSAIIEVFVSTDRLARISPRSTAGGVALGIAAGVVLPTCECGVVPVAVRLMKKGVPPYVAISYMLAAPIVNPIVLASTFVAFRYSFALVVGRAAVAVVVATVVATVARRLPEVLATRGNRGPAEAGEHSHDHSPSHSGRLRSVMVHAGRDFIDMGKFLILGSVAAALFKTLIPFDEMRAFADNEALSIIGMMILAVLLSVCSEADAFVAASFVMLPGASHLAFIGIGPMVDLKLIGMYGVTFSRRMLVALMAIPTLLVFLLSWMAGLWNLV
jgi:uncharacterized membrane protein YraQ (UPF0718 family)